MRLLCQLEKKTIFFANHSAAGSISPKIFYLEQKKQIYLFSIQKYLKKYVAVIKNIDF